MTKKHTKDREAARGSRCSSSFLMRLSGTTAARENDKVQSPRTSWFTLPRAKRLGQKMTWDLARGSPVSKAPAIYPRRAALA